MSNPYPTDYALQDPYGNRLYDALEGFTGEAKEAEASRLRSAAATAGLPVRT
ncbi:hypothetical protein CLAFUW4_10967 [Fulvia fulva]|uniref:Uncharacterized protein n=1 Tax=Passalora fulva TaxID=5499 RepID=A0A9Q8URH8_PASFU|nr:uncharacterized protein CLAFUR5_10009 [Fulvia fulva]KAK4619712.1 hypothetical protein CLAFUR4_10972 [Fulvia fulva]KAK4620365.1 hypothetical protein CLAFUR0_10979 [Fulvia fulva]UJO19824.1 hypothetical protein CLAFUR5_10009 [Fulvia fulva]WPV17682.1 hypothetical protein CLAFUW4_10967 [Fulvia fulva]WPV31878.1 hypothetical protein CLAFUW7_10965 [Fulvia fulva]